MNLLATVLVFAIVVVVAILAVYYAYTLFSSSSGQQLTEQHAESLIVSDLQAAYPNAIVNITNATSSTYAGSWHIVASVTENATSPCPSYFINTYDYPQFRFVSTPQNTYTANCKIYVFSPNSAFRLGSAPVAIAWASKHVPNIIYFISRFGYGNVNASAKYQVNATEGDVWLLAYISPLANYTAHAVLADTNGTLISVYNTTGSGNSTFGSAILPANVTAVTHIYSHADSYTFACAAASNCTVVHTSQCFNNAASQQTCINTNYLSAYEQAYNSYYASSNGVVCAQYYVNANVSCTCLSSECNTVYTTPG